MHTGALAQIRAKDNGSSSQVKTIKTELADLPTPEFFDSHKMHKVQEGGFAQVRSRQETSTTTHGCDFSQNRNKEAVDDFYSIYSGTEKYTDDDFKNNTDSLFWADIGQSNPLLLQYEWKRAGEALSNRTLFGTHGITPEDVRQGQIGNCWFMTGAAALAERAHRLERVFLNNKNELSPNGIYAVNFYTLGVPHTVVVDDYLPLIGSGYTLNSPFAGMRRYIPTF